MPIDEVHYLNSDGLTPERKMQESYLRSIINQFGINSTYFRHDAAFYESPVNNYIDYIYGEDTTMTFNVKSPVRIYIDMKRDAVLMNQMGIETNADADAYVVIDDFTEQFRDMVGKPMFTNVCVKATGTLVNGKGTVKADINNGCLNGYVDWDIDINYEEGGVTGDVIDTPFKRYPKEHNPYILNSGEYGSRLVTGGLSGKWYGEIDSDGNGEIEAVLKGELFYYTGPAHGAGPNWGIAPQVGDFFRLEYDKVNGNLEEYEITQIEDRNLQTDGISPLLGRYVWKMSIKRREPSYENVIGDDCEDSIQEEAWTVDKLRISNLNELISDEIFDYREEKVNELDGINADKIYGGYDMDPEPVIPEEPSPVCEDIHEVEEKIVSEFILDDFFTLNNTGTNDNCKDEYLFSAQDWINDSNYVVDIVSSGIISVDDDFVIDGVVFEEGQYPSGTCDPEKNIPHSLPDNYIIKENIQPGQIVSINVVNHYGNNSSASGTLKMIMSDPCVYEGDMELEGKEINVNPVDPSQCSGSVNYDSLSATIELTGGYDEDIYYTLDGTEPTISSSLYTGPITVTTDTIVKSITVDSGLTQTGSFTDYVTFIDSTVNRPFYVNYGDHTGYILSGDLISDIWSMENKPSKIIDLISDRDPSDFEPFMCVIKQIVPEIVLSISKNQDNDIIDLGDDEDYNYIIELVDNIAVYTNRIFIKNFCSLISKGGTDKVSEFISTLRDKGFVEIIVDSWIQKSGDCDKVWDIDGIMMYMDSDNYSVRINKAKMYQKYDEDINIYYTYDNDAQQALNDAELDTPLSSIELMEIGLDQQNSTIADVVWVPSWNELYNPATLGTLNWIDTNYGK